MYENNRQTYLYEGEVSPDNREAEGQGQTEWILYRQTEFYTERWGATVCVTMCVCMLWEFLSVRVFNTRITVSLCVCMCVCVVRAGGHRRIKRRQKDEYLAGLGRTEGWPHRTNGGVPLGRWRGGWQNIERLVEGKQFVKSQWLSYPHSLNLN